VLTGNLTLTNGATLTIGPGTVVKFERLAGLIVGGTLNVNGAAAIERTSPRCWTTRSAGTRMAMEAIRRRSRLLGPDLFQCWRWYGHPCEVRYAGSSFPDNAGIFIKDALPRFHTARFCLSLEAAFSSLPGAKRPDRR